VQYEWKNIKTGEVVTVERKLADYLMPPDKSGQWERVISPFGVGRVEGGGGSPNRTSISKETK